MKPKLNRKDQSKQNKLRKMLATGLPLSALLTGLLGCSAGCEFLSRTSGDVPNPETSSQSKPDMPGKTPKEPLMEEPIIRGDMPPERLYDEVRKGDTLYSIAKRHGTTVDQLKKLNGFSDKAAARLKVGQKIRIQ